MLVSREDQKPLTAGTYWEIGGGLRGGLQSIAAVTDDMLAASPPALVETTCNVLQPCTTSLLKVMSAGSDWQPLRRKATGLRELLLIQVTAVLMANACIYAYSKLHSCSRGAVRWRRVWRWRVRWGRV